MACHSVDGTKGTFDGNAKKGISSPFFLIHKAAHVAIPARRATGGTDDLGYKTLVVQLGYYYYYYYYNWQAHFHGINLLEV